MRSRARGVALLALLALAGAGAATAEAESRSPAPGALAATRPLLLRLRAAGRAEAAVRLTRTDPLSGRTQVVRGRLALELPGLARLDLADGQRLTLREDGGDLLQPVARQLVRAGARSAAGVLAWWAALLDPEGGGFRERKRGAREFVLLREGAAEDEGQRLVQGADGLPERIVVALGAGEQVEYRLSRWRFLRARGRKDFVLEAPAGFEVVEMP